MVVFDSIKDEMVVVTPVYPARGDRRGDCLCPVRCNVWTASFRHWTSRYHMVPSPGPEALKLPATTSNTSADDYKAMVLRAKDYIAAGDIFQVVLSQRFSAPFGLSSMALYRALRRTKPVAIFVSSEF